ncbi:hypothetical protein D3C83_280340 [compost metagenome]
MGRARITLMSSANPASSSVAGRRSVTRAIADFPWYLRESPKSPWTAFLTKMKYCVASGLSRPQCFSSRA